MGNPVEVLVIRCFSVDYSTTHNVWASEMKIISLGHAYLSALTDDMSGTKLTPFDRLVKIAQAAPCPPGYEAEYDLLRPHFDHAYYFATHPAVARSKQDPLAHYIRAGDKEGRQPTSWFAPDIYRKRVPEAEKSGKTTFGHWLGQRTTLGQKLRQRFRPASGQGVTASPLEGFDEVAQHLGLDPHTQWLKNRGASVDLKKRIESGVLGRMIDSAATLEPQIADSQFAATRLRIKPFTGDEILTRYTALTRLQDAAQHIPADIVILADATSQALAGYPALGLAQAYATQPQCPKVVLLMTGAPLPLPAIYEGVNLRVIALDPVLNSITSNSDTQAQTSMKMRLVADFIRSLGAGDLLCYPTPITEDLLASYGPQLGDACRLVALQEAQGLNKGAVSLDWVPDCIDLLLTPADSTQFPPILTQADRKLAIQQHHHFPVIPAQIPTSSSQPKTITAALRDHTGAFADLFMAIAQTRPKDVFRLLVPHEQDAAKRFKYYPPNVTLQPIHALDLHSVFADTAIWLDLHQIGDLDGIALLACLAGTLTISARGMSPDLQDMLRGNLPAHLHQADRYSVRDLADTIDAIATDVLRSQRPSTDDLRALCDAVQTTACAQLAHWSNDAPDLGPTES